MKTDNNVMAQEYEVIPSKQWGNRSDLKQQGVRIAVIEHYTDNRESVDKDISISLNNHYKLIEALQECYSLLEDYNEEIPNNAKIARERALKLLNEIEKQ